MLPNTTVVPLSGGRRKGWEANLGGGAKIDGHTLGELIHTIAGKYRRQKQEKGKKASGKEKATPDCGGQRPKNSCKGPLFRRAVMGWGKRGRAFRRKAFK